MTCTLPFNSPADGKPCFYEEKLGEKPEIQWIPMGLQPHSPHETVHKLTGAFYVGNGWVAGGCWDDY